MMDVQRRRSLLGTASIAVAPLLLLGCSGGNNKATVTATRASAATAAIARTPAPMVDAQQIVQILLQAPTDVAAAPIAMSVPQASSASREDLASSEEAKIQS